MVFIFNKTLIAEPATQENPINRLSIEYRDYQDRPCKAIIEMDLVKRITTFTNHINYGLTTQITQRVSKFYLTKGTAKKIFSEIITKASGISFPGIEYVPGETIKVRDLQPGQLIRRDGRDWLFIEFIPTGAKVERICGLREVITFSRNLEAQVLDYKITDAVHPFKIDDYE